MTAIDNFFDTAHTYLVHVQERLNKLDLSNIPVPMGDHLTPEETQDALASILSQEALLEQLKRETEHERRRLRTACDAAKADINSLNLGRRQKKRKKVAITQMHQQVRNHCQKFETLVDQLLAHLVDQKHQLMLHEGQDPNQS